MFKKILSSFLLLAMMVTSFALPVLAEETEDTVECTTEYAPVCGMDNNTYSNRCVAEEQNKVDVSYEGVCSEITNESQAEEEMSDIHFVGMLIEIGSTDLPTTIIVRDNSTKEDYTVNVTADTVLGQRRDQTTQLSDWIPGDQIRVIGEKNENTNVVDATTLVNLAVVYRSNLGANGWITKIDTESKKITYQWNNVEHTFEYNDNTRFVAGLKNPASVEDLKVGDRIRGRLLVRTGETPLAKIVVVLRRGSALFMKIRTFRPNVTLVSLASTIVPTTITVRIDKTPGLKVNDVNNLIGDEGGLVTVNVSENTALVRKYFGRTTLDEFSIDDKLSIVGRVNDDGTVDAKLIKNNSIWKISTRGHAGVVQEVNVEENYLMVNWTPVQYMQTKNLKKFLKQKREQVSAQTVLTEGMPNPNAIKSSDLRPTLLQRIKTKIKAKVGNLTRIIKNKKVVIDRIKASDVKVRDLVKRLPVRKIRIEITEDTKIVVGTNVNATIEDIQIGDKVRIRGLKHKTLSLVVADTIVVVNSLPEIDEPLDTNIDDVNEIVTEIVIEEEEGNIIDGTTSDTEGEVVSEDEEEENNS